MSVLISGAARREFAKGWPATLAAALAISVGMMGIGFYSLGLFVKPLQDEFGWSRAAVSGAATFQQFGIFASAPLVGLLADRIGVRSIAIASYVATPLALVALSQAGPSIPGWYALWFLVSVAGCGTTPAVWARVVTTRFDSARGLALGVMLLGTGTAAILAPALLGPVFVTYGWRTAVFVIAAVTALVGLPVSLLMPRDRPARVVGAAPARRRFEANRQTIILQVVAILLGAIVAGLIIHLVPLLVDRGMPLATAAQAAAVIGIAVLFARVVVGYLFDRCHAPYVAGLFLLSPVVSALLLWLDGPVVPAALLLGLAAGAEVDMLAYFTSRYARIENYGATYGVTLGLFCLGAGCGPMLFGWSVDHSGSYDAALIASAMLLLAVVTLIVTLGPYRTETSPG
ncbi:MFS transporter [Sphingomonas sp. HF-S4]|uniref:MFS transporter n=1 Tax=Sphingomonas agrestis TaxID=3080540 RepID=A0ABU3Y3W5_9SPHN|nr:MFS transporter [Sphingomonas sp. HF-S4]MDV3456076.1 MFS transporter [Sphingomonas sp. HF-S4]